MGWVLKTLAKTAAKASKIDPTDVMNQQTVSDLLTIVKGVFL